MGDHNVPLYDQPMWGSYEPVLPDWIVGKAVGEIPWFGLIKLKVTGTDLQDVPQNSWRNLIITLFIILLVPFLFDLFAPKVAKKLKERKERKKKQDGEGNEQSAAEPEQPPPQEDMGGASESREMKTDPASASEPKIHTEKTKNETE